TVAALPSSRGAPVPPTPTVTRARGAATTSVRPWTSVCVWAPSTAPTGSSASTVSVADTNPRLAAQNPHLHLHLHPLLAAPWVASKPHLHLHPHLLLAFHNGLLRSEDLGDATARAAFGRHARTRVFAVVCACLCDRLRFEIPFMLSPGGLWCSARC